MKSQLLLCAVLGLLVQPEGRAGTPASIAPVSPSAKDVLVPGAWDVAPTGWTDLLMAIPLTDWIRVSLPPTMPLSERNPWRYDALAGILTCEGTGIHEMLLFPQPQRDGVFHVEWRYIGVLPKPNSGIFVRTRRDNTVWYQAQLAPVSSGVLFGASPAADGTPRKLLVGSKRPDLIRPPGEWNTMEVTIRGYQGSLWYNGVVVAETDQLAVREGHLGFEAEGAPIEFRRVLFKPARP